ncbi:MAG: hypothetical protein JSS64_10135 [Bacteroidetes bacterium]|nr:hypothetical protein [Bacteroidota bacterium]
MTKAAANKLNNDSSLQTRMTEHQPQQIVWQDWKEMASIKLFPLGRDRSC